MNETNDDKPDALGTTYALRPRLVGAFTLLGLALIVGGLAAVRTTHWFQDYRTFVVFFTKPTGLKEGAPVTIRQAPVGEVRSVELVLTGRGIESETQVVIAIRKGAMNNLGKKAGIYDLTDAQLVDVLVKAGLRAGVRSSSPLAGQKSLDLDFLPHLKPRYAGIAAPYPEFPTAPSNMEILREKVDATLQNIADIPLDEMLLEAQGALSSARRLLENKDIEGALRNANLALGSLDATLKRTGQTLDRVDGLLTAATATATTADTTLRNVDAMLDRLDTTLATVDRNVERTADAQFEVVKNLDEMNELLRSLRRVTETLQRNPEALLQGKPEPKEKP